MQKEWELKSEQNLIEKILLSMIDSLSVRLPIMSPNVVKLLVIFMKIQSALTEIE